MLPRWQSGLEMLVRKAMLLKRKLNEPSDDITGIINPNT
jgi:hypothetical protein